MSGKKIDEKVVSIPEVKKIMENVKQKIELIGTDENISHFQEITYDYVNKFAKMSEKDAIKIKKFLIDKYEIEENYAINVINIFPHTIYELRTILEKSYVGKTLNDDQLQDIIYQIEEFKSS